MRKKPLQSIYELASQTGVSASTVSRVLNQRSGIGDSTRRKVLAVARQAGFRPRMTARPLTIALVVDRSRFATFGGFVPCLLANLVQIIARQDLAVELFTEQSLDHLTDRLVDGVLAMAWDDSTIDRIRQLKDVPVVTINRMDVPEFSAVATDHRRDGQLAVDYLAGRGHRRIAMICEEPQNWGSQQRVEGFTTTMRQMGLDCDDRLVAFTEHQPIYGLLRRMLQLKPTAIFLANESLGLEATYILRDVMHVRVPDDISLIGMESPQVSQFLSPPMTTLVQPLEELAESAVSLLVRQAGQEKREPVRTMVANRLVERESVANITDIALTPVGARA